MVNKNTYSTPASIRFPISQKTAKNKENPNCLATAIFYSQNKIPKKLVVEFNYS